VHSFSQGIDQQRMEGAPAAAPDRTTHAVELATRLQGELDDLRRAATSTVTSHAVAQGNGIELCFTLACRLESVVADLAVIADQQNSRVWHVLLRHARRLPVELAKALVANLSRAASPDISDRFDERVTEAINYLEEIFTCLVAPEVVNTLAAVCPDPAPRLILPGYPEIGLYSDCSLDALAKAADERITNDATLASISGVVGIRLTGSFAGPIYTALLEEHQGRSLCYVTVRPMHKYKHHAGLTPPLGLHRLFETDDQKRHLKSYPSVLVHEADLATLAATGLPSSFTKLRTILVIDDRVCTGSTFDAVETFLGHRLNAVTFRRIPVGDEGRARDRAGAGPVSSKRDGEIRSGSEPDRDYLAARLLPWVRSAPAAQETLVTSVSSARSYPVCPSGDAGSMQCPLCQAVHTYWVTRFPNRSWDVTLAAAVPGECTRLFLKYVGIPSVARLERDDLRDVLSFLPPLLTSLDSFLVYASMPDYVTLAEYGESVKPQSLANAGRFLAAVRHRRAISTASVLAMKQDATRALQQIGTLWGVRVDDYFHLLSDSELLHNAGPIIACNLGGGPSPSHWLISRDGDDIKRCHMESGNDPCLTDVAEELFLWAAIRNTDEAYDLFNCYSKQTSDIAVMARSVLLAPITLLRIWNAETLAMASLHESDIRAATACLASYHGSRVRERIQLALCRWSSWYHIFKEQGSQR